MPSSPWRPTGRCAVGFGDDGGCSGTNAPGAPGWSSAQRPPSSPSDVRHAGPGHRAVLPRRAAPRHGARAADLLAGPEPAGQPARRRGPPAGLRQRQPGAGPPADPAGEPGRGHLASPARQRRVRASYHFNSDDRWFQQNVRFKSADLPAALRQDVLDGDTGRQRFVLGGQPFLAVGINVAEFDVQYFEVFPLAPAGPQPAGRRRVRSSWAARRRPCSPPPWAGQPAAASSVPSPALPTRPRSWRRAVSTPGWSPSRIRISTGW